MRRFANGTQVASLPAPAAVSGTPGYAAKGVAGVSRGSVIDADAWNIQQEELMAFLTAAGIAPDNTGANLAQVLAACRVLFGGVGLLNANGYMRLPGGLIAQWGRGVANSSGFVTLSFNIAFPSAALFVAPSDDADSASAVVSMGSKINSIASFDVWYQTSQAGSFSWFALGY